MSRFFLSLFNPINKFLFTHQRIVIGFLNGKFTQVFGGSFHQALVFCNYAHIAKDIRT